MMSLFNLTLSEKHFIYPSILNDSFAGYSNLACRSLPFMTWNTSFQPLLACKISFEKSAESYGNSFVSNCLSLAAFKILSFSLILGNVIMMCLGVFLLRYNLFGTLWASWTSWKSISFARLGTFSFIICSIKFSIFCSFESIFLHVKESWSLPCQVRPRSLSLWGCILLGAVEILIHDGC